MTLTCVPSLMGSVVNAELVTAVDAEDDAGERISRLLCALALPDMRPRNEQVGCEIDSKCLHFLPTATDGDSGL